MSMYGIYYYTRLYYLIDWISHRYLRHKEQYNGIDRNFWDEYALPLYKSPRDIAYEKDRKHSWRRRSFFDIVKEEKEE